MNLPNGRSVNRFFGKTFEELFRVFPSIGFKSFTHQHLFSEKEGITEMKDLFEYQSPWGILGKLANKLFLNMYLTNLLEKRNSVIKKIAESVQIP